MEQTQKKPKRLPKYKRDRESIKGLVIQPRDVNILKLIHDFRFINSYQIYALAEGSDDVILRRLQKLFHHGYLDRPRRQLIYGMHGSNPIIYGLGNKGADVIAENFGIDRGKIDWCKKNIEVKDRHIFHTQMISQVRAMVTLVVKENPGMELLFWKPEGKFNDSIIFEKNGKKIRVPIVPDGFFGVKYKEKKFYFFIEADLSTMTNKRFVWKMKGYWNYWKSGEAKKRLGIENFRVLTVSKSVSRRDNLCKATKRADDKQKGSSLFCFACSKQLDL